MHCTTAARLGVEGHFLDRVQVVGLDHVLDHHGVDGETLADQRALFVIVRPLLATIVGDGGLQSFTAHYRTVHLFRRQTVEVVGDVLVRDFERLIQRHALDHLGQRRRRGNGRAATESLEVRVLDDLGFRLDLEHQAQRIAALDGTDIADAVRIFQRAGVARVEEMFANLVRVFPHGVRSLNRE